MKEDVQSWEIENESKIEKKTERKRDKEKERQEESQIERQIERQIKNAKTEISTECKFSGFEFRSWLHKLIGDYKFNDDVWSLNLDGLSLAHKYLMNKVSEILFNEEDKNTAMQTESTKSFKAAANQVTHGTIGNRIVFLNGEREYIFIGDVHSDPVCIYKLLERTEFFKKFESNKPAHLVFTGDYVDRGKNHLETLSVILLLKYMFPDVVTLLQGNHDGGRRLDDGSIELPYRVPVEDDPMSYFPLFTDELAKKNDTFHTDMTDCYMTFFSKLPMMALIHSDQHSILAIHGGLPRPGLDYGRTEESLLMTDYYNYIKKLSDFSSEDVKDFNDRTIQQSMMWSDPERPDEELKLAMKRFRYSKAHFEAFIKRFDIDVIVRGHEAHEEGVVSYFDERLYTNFASGMFEDGTQNKETAYDFVKAHFMRYCNGEIEIVPL